MQECRCEQCFGTPEDAFEVAVVRLFVRSIEWQFSVSVTSVLTKEIGFDVHCHV